jgi:peptide methionine sulfoxide reductase MsrA
VAKEIVAGIKAAAGSTKVYCDVEKATRFYRAEEYHQDFLNKRGAR